MLHLACRRAMILALAALAVLAPRALADVRLPGAVGDHMVLQRDADIVLWGWADPGERVTATLAGDTRSATAEPDGTWRLTLPPRPAGGPFDLTVAAANTITLHDVLIGDVWLCAGQSNMEMRVSNVANAEAEIQAANHPRLRLFRVPRNKAATPQTECPGQWQACTPETVADFSATGYFFGRDLQAAIHVPIGLVDNSHGGTPAEAWMRHQTLRSIPELTPLMDQMDAEAEAWTSGATMAHYQARLADWQRMQSNPVAETDCLETFIGDGKVENLDLGGFVPAADGVGVVGAPGSAALTTQLGIARGNFELRAELSIAGVKNGTTSLALGNGQIGFRDSAWGRLFVRGPLFGGHITYLDHHTDDLITAGRPFTLTARRNEHDLVISINDTEVHRATCGIAEIGPVRVNPGEGSITVHELMVQGGLGPDVKETLAYAKPEPPTDPRLRHFHPSALFNAMVQPLLPMRLKGGIWYQGESNHLRAYQYRTLFPALIESWRAEWRQPDLPFLFVQIANYLAPQDEPTESDWAELREAQLMALRVPHTAMAVTIDVGDADDIHPKNKQAVGERLARAARATVYGQDIIYAGPRYRGMRVEGDRIRLSFDHVGGGLVAQAGPLRRFAIAGADRNFRWAHAVIDGDTVVVHHPEVPNPLAVRYAWSTNPEGCNLYNRAGLPASPFRTDDWPGLSDERHTR